MMLQCDGVLQAVIRRCNELVRRGVLWLRCDATCAVVSSGAEMRYGVLWLCYCSTVYYDCLVKLCCDRKITLFFLFI